MINEITKIDALEGLRGLEDNSVDIVITSPPYNLSGLRGFQHTKPKDAWHKAGVMYDAFSDMLPEDEYQRQQVEILNEIKRVIKDGGSVFYNHKNRYKDNRCHSPLEWIFKSDLELVQEIVWDRGATPEIFNNKFLPTTERIYWLTKGKGRPKGFKRNGKFDKDVWHIIADRNNSHPAPYPIELVDNILDCYPQGITVLDPYLGSGTTAISATSHNDNWIGFDVSDTYIDMAKERLSALKSK